MRISTYGTGSVIKTAVFCLAIIVAGLLLPKPGGLAVSATALVFLLFTLFFYRDPERNVPAEPGVVIAPADGRILITHHVDHPVTGADSTLVSIFMSPFDVHVNRMPIDGRVLDVRYVPGKFLMAFDHSSMTDNERTEITLETAAGTVWFCQVSGFLARRIVCKLGKGQKLSAGERFGMIKLGSRVDIVLPPTIHVSASVGKRTVAGETVLGKASCF